MLNNILNEKNDKLGGILRGMDKVLVAFSGGVDSTLVLKRAQEELGDNVLAVIVSSELFRDKEFALAEELAHKMGVRVHRTEIKELDDEGVRANTPESWYHSKKLLYTHLNKLAEEMGYTHVLDGMIMDDINDFRPGLRARSEEGVRSVLQEADLYKQEVRALSKTLNLPVWNKPASCSLASRIPYGTPLTREKIAQVNKAELFIGKLGFNLVRVRHHENTARIEVPPEDIAGLLENREQILMKLSELGFTYISLDMHGYRTGSMNETLQDETTKSIS